MIHFIGRLDRQVKIRGFRVDPAEIEYVLSAHESVDEEAIRIFDARTDHPWLMAYAVAREGAKVREADLLEYLRGKLPHYMIPRGVMLIEEMPKNVNGKIDLKKLPKPADESASGVDDSPERDRDGMEETFHQIFCSVLKRDHVRLTDDFFFLGGDSLHTMQVIMRAQQASLVIQPQDLVLYPTIEKLAAHLKARYYDDQEQSEWNCMVPLQIAGDRSPLLLFHPTPGDVMGYGNLVHHLGTERPVYGFISPGLLPGGEAPETIEEMAKHFIEILLESEVKGPYYLGGWCYGGILAAEAARQLMNRGHEVAYLGLFDAIARPLKKGAVKQKVYRLKNALVHNPGKLTKFLWHQTTTRFFKKNEPTKEEIGGNNEGALENRSRVYESNSKAYDDYRGEVYPGKVHVYLSTQGGGSSLPNITGGWDVAADQHEASFVDCSHTDILKAPAVADLAEQMNRSMDAVESGR